MLRTREALPSESTTNFLTTVISRIVVDKSTDHAKPHFDLFFTTISTSKEMFFFSVRELKKALRDTLTIFLLRKSISKLKTIQKWLLNYNFLHKFSLKTHSIPNDMII